MTKQNVKGVKTTQNTQNKNTKTGKRKEKEAQHQTIITQKQKGAKSDGKKQELCEIGILSLKTL